MCWLAYPTESIGWLEKRLESQSEPTSRWYKTHAAHTLQRQRLSFPITLAAQTQRELVERDQSWRRQVDAADWLLNYACAVLVTTFFLCVSNPNIREFISIGFQHFINNLLNIEEFFSWILYWAWAASLKNKIFIWVWMLWMF